MSKKVFGATKGFFSEFKTFAVKGNALELAIAVVIGAAFTAIVNSLVGDIITPLIGLITNNVDVKSLAFTMRPEVVIKYGAFLQAIINFLLVSLAIFAVFKLISGARKRLSREEEKKETPKPKPEEIRLLEEIRDLLKEKN
jgi:large conductance mechanosensitive channel